MFITDKNRIHLAIVVAFQNLPHPSNRLIRARVLFPDLGMQPVLYEIGICRYSGEKSIIKPEATDEELSLPEGLTINLRLEQRRMADKHHPLQGYFRQLNDYHCKLSSCAELTAYLIDCVGENSQEEWHIAGCFLMRDMLRDLSQNLPFPSLDLQKNHDEVAS